MTNLLQNSPYLREQRKFPSEDIKQLSLQCDLSYIDIAQKVNARTIGIFGTEFSVVTGEQWFLDGSSKKQQTLRQVYEFDIVLAGTSLDIPTNITTGTERFTRIYGTVNLSSGDILPLPYPDPATLTDGVTMKIVDVSGVQYIRITAGTTVSDVNSGIAILEWLSPF